MIKYNRNRPNYADTNAEMLKKEVTSALREGMKSYIGVKNDQIQKGDIIEILEKGTYQVVASSTAAGQSATYKFPIDPNSTSTGKMLKNGKLFKRVGDLLLNTQTRELTPIRKIPKKERDRLLKVDRFDHVIGEGYSNA